MFKFLKRNLSALFAIAFIIGTCCLQVEGFLYPSNLAAENVVYKTYSNVSKYDGKRCNRVCREGKYRICHFEFNLEMYPAMGIACGKCNQGVESDCNNPQCIVGDGFDKNVMSINRQAPGPAIQVCKNDIVIVDVNNDAHGTAASLHWHGMHMIDTPYMDGVPFVTQCPIPFSNRFRYQFRASEPGTHFYHSHAGHHKANGQYGALIVRQPEQLEPLRGLYDHDLPEHYIFITDWMHVIAEEHYPGLNTGKGVLADSIIINGRGVYTNPQTLERTRVRPTIFYVTPGKRYRFRLINSMNHACPVQMQIEKHSFTIIATDSFSLNPDTFDTLFSNSGERYDFILEASQTNGDFWLRARGLGACDPRPIESYALIRYRTNENDDSVDDLPIPPFPNYDELYEAVRVLNHPNATCWSGTGNKCITELTALEQDEALLNAKPDHQFFLGFNNYEVPSATLFKPGEYSHFANLFGDVTVVGGINNISLVYPDYPPLTQPELVKKSHFCNSRSKPAKCDGHRLCHCAHRLKAKLNSIVELIIVDESATVNPVNHPFHLHGHRFVVTGMGQDPLGIPMSVQQAQEMENSRLLKKQDFNGRPPVKDSISIPSRGYVIIRFRASNPGFWMMHCHYEWHLAIGMGLVLQVGKRSEMVKPPTDFPKCTNYLPHQGTRARQFNLKNFSADLLALLSKYTEYRT